MIYCLVYLKIEHSFQKHCQHIFREVKLHIPKQFTKTVLKKKRNVFHICFFIYIINFRCSKLLDLFVSKRFSCRNSFQILKDDHTCGRSTTWVYSSERKSSCHPVVHSHRSTHSPLGPRPQYSSRKC